MSPPPAPAWDSLCHCPYCLTFTNILATYMLRAMEPTDRALRLPGDIYPAERPS